MENVSVFFYGHSEYFVVICYILPVLVYFTKKNLATLGFLRNSFPSKEKSFKNSYPRPLGSVELTTERLRRLVFLNTKTEFFLNRKTCAKKTLSDDSSGKLRPISYVWVKATRLSTVSTYL
jgi:hypothetical protein